MHADGPLAVDFNPGAEPLRADLGAWDTLSLPAGSTFAFINTGEFEAQALLVVQGDSPKRPTFDRNVRLAAAELDFTLDAGGHLVRRSLLPPSMVPMPATRSATDDVPRQRRAVQSGG